MPSGGGLATLAPQVAAARTRTRKKAAEERVIPICPNCLHRGARDRGVRQLRVTLSGWM